MIALCRTKEGKIAASRIYQFKITLRGIRPPIWRRFQVSSNIDFYTMRRIVQDVMGWVGGHLYLFDLGGLIVTDAETLAELSENGVDDRAILQEHLTREGQKICYDYDFGDGWEHDLLLEKILPPEADRHYPHCLQGKRACPPEDCGGIWGYEEMLEALADKKHEEHEMYLEWVGEEFDPEAFDLAGTNDILSQM